jgi:hypothetical protein
VPPGVGVVYLKSASYGAFLYQRMIDRVEGNVADGDLVAVMDKRGSFFGWGFYNSRSQLALRMFSHDSAMPTDELIALRVAKAAAFRRSILRLDETTDAYRLVHAEGDGLSGLIADRFGDYVVIELFSLAMFRRLQMIQDAIVDSGLSVKQFVVRADKSIAEQEGFDRAQVSDGVPIAPVDTIVVMKLLAGRSQDLADVEAIVESGTDREPLRAGVRRAAPERVDVLERLFANVDARLEVRLRLTIFSNSLVAGANSDHRVVPVVEQICSGKFRKDIDAGFLAFLGEPFAHLAQTDDVFAFVLERRRNDRSVDRRLLGQIPERVLGDDRIDRTSLLEKVGH